MVRLRCRPAESEVLYIPECVGRPLHLIAPQRVYDEIQIAHPFYNITVWADELWSPSATLTGTPMCRSCDSSPRSKLPRRDVERRLQRARRSLALRA